VAEQSELLRALQSLRWEEDKRARRLIAAEVS